MPADHEPAGDPAARHTAHHPIPAAAHTGTTGSGPQDLDRVPRPDRPDGTGHAGPRRGACPEARRTELDGQRHAGHPAFGAPNPDTVDVAVTGAHRYLPGDLDAGLIPGIELGGIQVTAWREGGALQVDVLLEDADGTAWKLDAGYLAVAITVAGETVHHRRHELPNACTRCGNSTADGEGYNGLCGTCADRDYAAGEAAEDQERE